MALSIGNLWGNEERAIDFPRAVAKVFGTLRAVVIFAILAIVCFLWGLWANIGLAVLIAAGSLVVGAFLGFLFGIPRALTKENSVGYLPNTNLEQVSDWLTKIIIGVSLVEFQGIQRQLVDTVLVLERSFIHVDEPYAFVWALIVFFGFYGFIGAYLYTRVFLPTIFKMADRTAVDEKQAEDIAKKVMYTIADQNAEAVRLAEFQLSTGPVVIKVEEADLTKAIHGATQNVKSEIFFKARKFRIDREYGTMEQRNELVRALPIFDALIVDDEGTNPLPIFHSNYAQHAFILLHVPQPDYGNARRYLDKAIEVRDRVKEKDHKHYELCRAIANLGLLNVTDFEGPSIHKDIEADLRAALTEPATFFLDTDQRLWVEQWLKERNITDIKLPPNATL